MGPFVSGWYRWPHGSVTDIGSVCASRDLRLEFKPHHRVLFGTSKGFLSMFRRFFDMSPPKFRFCESPLKMGLSGPLGPPWPGGAVTDIGSVCASRDLRLESKPHL